ncbi:MAG: phosphate signaling complex PhoU family protein [Pseudonocardiales bacterium]
MVILTRAAFHTELNELMRDLASMGRLVSQIMINASAALLQTDLTLARLVIARGEAMEAQHHDARQRCRRLLALYAPTSTDVRIVVMALHTVGDLQQMSHLAQRIARIARLTPPNLTIPDDVRTLIAQMSLLASGLAHHAATAIEKLDPLASDRLTRADDEVDALRRQLSRIVLAKNWSHGAGPAVHAVLIGHYYERFADHAVAISKQVCSLTIGADAGATSAHC